MSASPIDRLLIAADNALRTLSGAAGSARAAPGRGAASPESPEARRHAAGLMRVNHAGEICAQALYAGQAIVARDPAVRRALERAGAEERDHLSWCRERLGELGSRPSVLDPFWYAGSLVLGMASGLAGDRWGLGFLVETERQVERHLDSHLEALPAEDARSRAIVTQMREEEIAHGRSGEALGAVALPLPVRAAMGLVSKAMTRAAYWV
jgi:ubiquinone biosynthesis monooxygenase Coq7